MTPTANNHKQAIREYLASIEGVEKVYDVNGYDTDHHGNYTTWWVSLRYLGKWQSGLFIPDDSGIFPSKEYIKSKLETLKGED